MRVGTIFRWGGFAAVLAASVEGAAQADPPVRHRPIRIRDDQYPALMNRFSAALRRHLSENGGHIPRSPEALAPQLPSRNDYSHAAAALLSGHFVTIDYLGRRVDSIDNPGHAVFIYQRLPLDDGAYWVLALDGSVERMPREALSQRLAAHGADPPPEQIAAKD